MRLRLWGGGKEQATGIGQTEEGLRVQDRWWEALQPLLECVRLLVQKQRNHQRGDQGCRPGKIGGSKRRLHGLEGHPVLFIPAAGACIQGSQALSPHLSLRAHLKHLGKQMMITIPLPPLIQRDKEQVACSSSSRRSWPWCSPVTASHKGPVKRSRIEVCSRKACTASG